MPTGRGGQAGSTRSGGRGWLRGPGGGAGGAPERRSRGRPGASRTSGSSRPRAAEAEAKTARQSQRQRARGRIATPAAVGRGWERGSQHLAREGWPPTGATGVQQAALGAQGCRPSAGRPAPRAPGRQARYRRLAGKGRPAGGGAGPGGGAAAQWPALQARSAQLQGAPRGLGVGDRRRRRGRRQVLPAAPGGGAKRVRASKAGATVPNRRGRASAGLRPSGRRSKARKGKTGAQSGPAQVVGAPGRGSPVGSARPARTPRVSEQGRGRPTPAVEASEARRGAAPAGGTRGRETGGRRRRP